MIANSQLQRCLTNGPAALLTNGLSKDAAAVPNTWVETQLNSNNHSNYLTPPLVAKPALIGASVKSKSDPKRCSALDELVAGTAEPGFLILPVFTTFTKYNAGVVNGAPFETSGLSGERDKLQNGMVVPATERKTAMVIGASAETVGQTKFAIAAQPPFIQPTMVGVTKVADCSAASSSVAVSSGPLVEPPDRSRTISLCCWADCTQAFSQKTDLLDHVLGSHVPSSSTASAMQVS